MSVENTRYHQPWPHHHHHHILLLHHHHHHQKQNISCLLGAFICLHTCQRGGGQNSQRSGVFLWRNEPKRRYGSSFSEGCKPERRSELFSGIGITNTPSPPDRILGHSKRSGIFFLKKNSTVKDHTQRHKTQHQNSCAKHPRKGSFLFNDAFSVTYDYIASMIGWYVNDELEIIL
jgi:hypothetical protein